jgi:GAF domain-containing protein
MGGGDKNDVPDEALDLSEDLTTLNQIVETLNRAVDVRGALDSALARLVALMGLETGWIFVKAPAAQDRGKDAGYVLAAHHNLPPALADADVWVGGCKCQRLCDQGRLTEAYNEVRCSRLGGADGDRRGLAVHASVPLRSADRVLGILNVAGPDWASFSSRALALLTNVGNQMGIALERAQLFDLLKEQRVHEQAALLDLSNQLLSRVRSPLYLSGAAGSAATSAPATSSRRLSDLQGQTGTLRALLVKLSTDLSERIERKSHVWSI